jgi:hypothetical protein
MPYVPYRPYRQVCQVVRFHDALGHPRYLLEMKLRLRSERDRGPRPKISQAGRPSIAGGYFRSSRSSRPQLLAARDTQVKHQLAAVPSRADDDVPALLREILLELSGIRASLPALRRRPGKHPAGPRPWDRSA